MPDPGWLLVGVESVGSGDGQRLINIPHHELLVFWVELLALWSAARLLGAGARRVGLPSVVGELSAGLVLGPSIFGAIWLGGFDWFLPAGEAASVQSSLLLGVGWFSAAFLLMVAGFETDLNLITRLGRPALLVTIGSISVPFIGGLFTGYQIPESLWGEEADRLTVTLFIALSVAVSALAVVAKVLSDLGLMRRDVGQITVAAGMANDLIGWIILGVISGLAVSGTLSVGDTALTVIGLVAFLAGALTIGQRVIDTALRYVRREGANLQGALTVAIAAMFVFGVLTQWLGVEAVLGTFVAGVVLARSRYQQVEAAHVIEDLTSAVFAPLFFATAGLRVDLSLLEGDALTWTIVLLAVALGLKFVGAFGGAVLGGLSTREGLIVGAGLNARGALEIIIATVALSLGVFSQTTFTMIVIIPLVTSLVASVGVRTLASNLEGSVAERERLAREAAMAKNLVVRDGPILIPSTGSKSAIVAAQVVHFAWPDSAQATILSIDRAGTQPDIEPITNTLFDRQVELIRAEDTEAAEAMIAQSRLGYSVAAVGSSEGGGSVLSPFAYDLLNELHIPMVIVRPARNTGDRLPGIFARALVPVAGSRSSRAALELAGNLSANLGTQLTISHVVYQDVPIGARAGGGVLHRILDVAAANADDADDKVLVTASAQATELRASFTTETRLSTNVGAEIMRHANQIDADLIIVGAELRRLEGTAYLGQNVEAVLEGAPQTVVVVVLPPRE